MTDVDAESDSSEPIADLQSIPEDSTQVFVVYDRKVESTAEAILVRPADGTTAWLNYCQHFTHIKLDKGSGAEMRDGEIICTNHGAYFESDTGYCTHGPCVGAYLTEIPVEVSDGLVYIDSDRFVFRRLGAIERDQADLTSKSNRKF